MSSSAPNGFGRLLPTFALVARFAPKLRSLRIRALLVVLAIVTVPMGVVLASTYFEKGLGEVMLGSVRDGMRETAFMLAAQDAPEDPRDLTAEIDRIARRHKVRVRVLDEDAEVLVDANRDAESELWRTVSNVWYGRDVPSLAAFDRTLGVLPDRREVSEARARGISADCRTAAAGEYLVCHAVQTIEATGRRPARIVYVQDCAPRSLGALRDVNRQLTIVMLLVLPLALAMGWWLGWRYVQPIERLRAQLLQKAAGAAPSAHVDLESQDEFADLTSAFNSLLTALQVRAKANEEFVADLAHEFKNPVAAIRGAAEALGGGAVDGDRAARLAGLLRDSSRRLDVLLTQFLELARAEAGMPKEHRDEVDLDALCRGIVDGFASDERWRSRSFVVKAGGAKVVGVADRIESALRNVIDNAVSFASDGGAVRVESSVESDFAVVRVTDTGPGIPAEDLPRVFDRFFTKRASDRGTGLGLALVRAVVEAHGGTVAVFSPPGEGATFELRLPRRPALASMVGRGHNFSSGS